MLCQHRAVHLCVGVLPAVNVRVSKVQLKIAAKRRPEGYEQDVISAAVKDDGTHLHIPSDAYEALVEKYARPARPQPSVRRPAKPQQAGPGTELKALLKKVGIVATPGCSCNTRAKTMDEMEAKEPGWCEKNIETICDWLQEEATKRKLPFVRAAGRLLIRKAISNHRKKGQ